MSDDPEERENELLALQSIFTPEEFVRGRTKSAGEIRVSVRLPEGFTVSIKEGQRLRQYEITVLPPLSLTFELPAGYPSSSPPSFTLDCSWLTEKQLTSVGDHLTDIYQASGGAVVLFDWVQFLREDALRFLNIDGRLELLSEDTLDSAVDPKLQTSQAILQTCNGSDSPPVGRSSEQVPQTPELIVRNQNGPSTVALSSTSAGLKDTSVGDPFSLSVKAEDAPLHLTASQKLMSQILIHDAVQQRRRFDTSMFDCEVCFMSHLGSDCLQLLACGHIFCRACISEYFSVQIKEGNVQAVQCPYANCTTTPTQAQVKDLVQEELFNRYDRLLLQKTLDSMSDVVYCPRLQCGAAVIREESGQVAVCSVCGFAFCVTCRKTYHGDGSCVPDISETMNDTPQFGFEELPMSKEGMMALWEDYTKGSKKRKELLENRYGHQAFRVTLSCYLSKSWIKLNTKYCPNCFVPIEKDGGCNQMYCVHCSRAFCWTYDGKAPPPYGDQYHPGSAHGHN